MDIDETLSANESSDAPSKNQVSTLDKREDDPEGLVVLDDEGVATKFAGVYISEEEGEFEVGNPFEHSATYNRPMPTGDGTDIGNLSEETFLRYR